MPIQGRSDGDAFEIDIEKLAEANFSSTFEPPKFSVEENDRAKMDPLSITASLIAILGAVGTTAGVLERLASLRDAPTRLLSLMNEVTDLKAMLSVVCDAVETLQQVDSASTKEVISCLQRLVFRTGEVIAELDTTIACILKQDLLPDKRGRPRISRIAWMRADNNLERLMSSLRDMRLNLAAALSAANTVELGLLPKLLLSVQDIALVNRRQLFLSSQFSIAGCEAAQSSFTQILSGYGDAAAKSSTQAGPKEGERQTQVLRVSTSLLQRKCKHPCRCRCHHTFRLSVPRWMSYIVGSLFSNYSGLPMLNRNSCDVPSCGKANGMSMRFDYHFPAWLLPRVLSLTGQWKNLAGAGANWTIRMPRVIPASSPIWTCIAQGDAHRIDELFKLRLASPYDVQSGDGQSVLHYALTLRQFDLCSLFTGYGADWGYQDVCGRPAAQQAWSWIFANDIDAPGVALLRQLLDEKGETYHDLELTPLQMVVLGLSSADLEEQLKLQCSDINDRDSFGRTPLIWASRRGSIETAQTLLDWNSDPRLVDEKGRTALHYAANKGSYDVCRALLDSGAEVDAADEFGQTPLYSAALYSGPIELIQLLLNRGANINSKLIPRGWTPLHAAAHNGSVEHISILLDNGAEIEASNCNGNSPIMTAITRDAVEAVRLLLARGAKVDMINNNGSNILALAATSASALLYDVLCSADLSGIDFYKRDNEGLTAWDCFERRQKSYHAGDCASVEDERIAFAKLMSGANLWKKELLDKKPGLKSYAIAIIDSDDEAFHSAVE